MNVRIANTRTASSHNPTKTRCTPTTAVQRCHGASSAGAAREAGAVAGKWVAVIRQDPIKGAVEEKS